VKRPVLFDVRVDPTENCYPMIPSGAAHNEMAIFTRAFFDQSASYPAAAK
jgi:hypothetical protein